MDAQKHREHISYAMSGACVQHYDSTNQGYEWLRPQKIHSGHGSWRLFGCEWLVISRNEGCI